MTYYEELGVGAGASPAEIRQAHRRLAKLLHPDLQIDDGLRTIAERQLSRINGIVEELLDPGRRAAYDSALGPSLPAPPALPAPAKTQFWRPQPAIGMIAVCGMAAAGLFLVASPTDAIRAETPASAAVESAPPARQARKISNAPQPERKLPSPRPLPARALPVVVPLVVAAAPGSEAASPEPTSKPAREPEMPKSDDAPSSATGPAAPTLAGVWLYCGGIPSERDKGLHKPEYIEMRLVEREGRLFGDYRSRYSLGALTVSPAVNFVFEAASPEPGTYPWTGAQGAEGMVTLRPAGPHALQVNWKVSAYGRSGIGFSDGAATLIRRR